MLRILSASPHYANPPKRAERVSAVALATGLDDRRGSTYASIEGWVLPDPSTHKPGEHLSLIRRRRELRLRMGADPERSAVAEGARVRAASSKDRRQRSRSTRISSPTTSPAPSHSPLAARDRSRPGRRRWCSMERCGNRDKTARYREKTALTRLWWPRSGTLVVAAALGFDYSKTRVWAISSPPRRRERAGRSGRGC